MIKADGSGYSGPTNWSLHDTTTMWTMLADHVTENHWRRVTAWRMTYELTLTHLSRLKDYRQRLTEAWPPEHSAAARAYVDRLDYLIESVQETYEAALRNHSVFAAATSALGSARSELKKIYDEYVAKRQAKLDFERSLEHNSRSTLTATSRMRPPVTDADLGHLDNRARQLMYALSLELQQAQAQIRQPPPYGGGMTIGPEKNGDGKSSTETVPQVPAVVPVPLQAVDTRIAHSGFDANRLSFPSIVPPAGPILGTSHIATSPTISTGGYPAAAPTTSSGTMGPPLLPPGPLVLPNTGGSGSFPPSINPSGTDSSARLTPGNGHSPARAMPLGGIIGSPPSGPMNQTTARSTPNYRVNPIGGIIGNANFGRHGGITHAHGGTGTDRPPGIMSISGMPSFAVSATTDHIRISRADTKQRWDPDNPWEITPGAPSVLEPPERELPVDPGPAIGLGR